MRAIPYNYYALLTILAMVLLVVLKIDYGPMKLHEDNAVKGDIYTTPDRPYANAENEIVRRKGKSDRSGIPDIGPDHFLHLRYALYRRLL